MYGYVPCTVQEHIYVYVYYVDYVQPGSRIYLETIDLGLCSLVSISPKNNLGTLL